MASILCILMFLLINFLQMRPGFPFQFKGILGQGAVLSSIGVVLLDRRFGFRIGVGLNLLGAMSVTAGLVVRRDIGLLVGIIVPLGTVFILAVLQQFGRRLESRNRELLEQREELLSVYEALSGRERDILEQNRRLLEYSRALEEKEESLSRLASFDMLTELPNRKMVIERLESRILLHAEHQHPMAVTFVDLDRFKQINDTAGHHAGDQALKAVVKRMRALLHPDDMLGRLGGDEFAIIVSRPFREEGLLHELEQMRQALEEPLVIEHRSFGVSASFGVALYPRDGASVGELLRCADTAMYKAKESGRNDIRFFDREMEAEIVSRVEMEAQLLRAQANGEFRLVYQPQYHAADRSLMGFEALLRWQSPERGAVPPDAFIPLAESMGLIVPMGEWVLREACRDMAAHAGHWPKGGVLSVNVSVLQMQHEGFVEMVERTLQETGFPAERLELEMTESAVLTALPLVGEKLTRLRDRGVRVALDDFGTGFSSLHALQELPIDVVKLDRAFVRKLGVPGGSEQMVGGILLLSHRLGLAVVAEGVETEAQYEFLREHGCDGIQGFLFARPLEADAVGATIHQRVAIAHPDVAP